MKNSYLLVVVVVLALIGGYFVFFNQTQETLSFDLGLTELNSFYEKQELKPVYLASSLKVYAIEESKLNTLKSDLTSFQSSLEKQENSEDKEKLLLLTELHLDLVSIALMQKQNFDLIDFFDETDFDADVLCSELDKAEQLQQGIALQSESAESFNAKVSAYSSAYPDEAVKAELTSLELDVSSDEDLDELQSVLDALKVVC